MAQLTGAYEEIYNSMVTWIETSLRDGNKVIEIEYEVGPYQFEVELYTVTLSSTESSTTRNLFW